MAMTTARRFLSQCLARRRGPVHPARVEIYTWRSCPFCIRARWLLRRRGVAFTEYRVGREDAARARMTERAAGRTTVPQVFINDTGIGGCSELIALDRAGRLEALLVEAPDAAAAPGTGR
jgi:glutaredoxin 3